MDKNSPKHLPMVRWFNPAQLIRTGTKVLISTILGSQIDYRNLEALQQPQEAFDYRNSDDGLAGEFWFDYVADLGDGWRSTFAIASLLAQESLTVCGADTEPPATTHELPRGRLLIMGGDQVYPVASRENYAQRLLGPYRAALPPTDESSDAHTDEPPDLFAIPGNHDWYDGLVSFMRLFCRDRSIGGWRTLQKRSYFALRLPHNWWLWGVDIQLEADIDQPQLEYFRKQAEMLEPNARVILCTPVPDWVYGTAQDEKSNLSYLEKKLIKKKDATLYVTVAGDLHHYRRHQNEENSNLQKLTSGGGGAFLSPTHGPDAKLLQVHYQEEATQTFVLKKAFPDEKTSRKLTWRTLLFPWYNPRFGFVTAITYLLTAWLLPEQVDQILRSPGILLWSMLIVALCIAYAQGRTFRLIGGLPHGLCHLVAAFLLSHIGRELAEAHSALLGWWLHNLLMLLGGYLVGPTMMGVYLFIALNLFRQHPNEAFAAIRVQDYKNFLRFHITRDGKLNIYPIGLRKVRDNASELEPQLIESVISVEPVAE